MPNDPPLALIEERIETPVGEAVLLSDSGGALRVLDFADYADRMRRLLIRHYGASGWTVTAALRPTDARERLRAYFAGDIGAVDDIRTASNGTDFQRQVWSALRSVRTPCSYLDLARLIGRPTATRAIGAANGANPIAIVVPCHRVIGHSGSLTGYGGGLERKAWLLAHEARHRRREGEAA